MDSVSESAEQQRVPQQTAANQASANQASAALVGTDRQTVDLTVAGHHLALFVESAPLMQAMVADIQRAERRVWMESYIFSQDSAGEAIAEALMERARAGLDVRLMYDPVGSFSTPNAFFTRMAEAGVKIHAYHTLWEALSRFSLLEVLNRRNHRKLLVIDDRVGYFGGMNVVDQSGLDTVDEVRDRKLPISAGWRDVHVRMEGPKQRELAEVVERLWQRVHDHERRRLAPWPLRQMLTNTEDDLFFFDCRPGYKYRSTTRIFTSLIRRAQRDITLSMAYFIPVRAVYKELLRARKRGVKIRIVIPGKSDVRLVQWATRYYYHKLLSRGIRIYERRDQMLHSKVMVIDDRWSLVGSCNLDPRSLRINLEFLSVIQSAELAAAIKQICAFEIRNSRRVTARDAQQRDCWQRAGDRFAWSVRRWL